MYKEIKNRIELYLDFINTGKIGTGSVPFYKSQILELKYILDILENDKLTPEIFDKLHSRDKWDVYKTLKNRVKWHCKGCGVELDTDPHGTFDEICCDVCDYQLTRRTGGGMNDPFRWTFKYTDKELRKLKLKSLK